MLTLSAGLTMACRYAMASLTSPLVESRAADQLIRQSGMHERAFKRTRLRVGTVHDGHVRIRRALLGADASDLPRYPRGLLLGVVRGIADDRCPMPNAVPTASWACDPGCWR